MHSNLLTTYVFWAILIATIDRLLISVPLAAWRWRSFAGAVHPRPVDSCCERCGYVHWRRRMKPAYYYLRDLFDLIIVDEGTKIRNLDSQMSQAVQGLRARHRLLLTGTPIKNYVPDFRARRDAHKGLGYKRNSRTATRA